MTGFDEHSLRADIARTWGEYGAHIDVFDTMLKRLNELEEIHKGTTLVKTEATIDEAFAALRKVREACPDVQLRVMTTTNVIEHLFGVDDIGDLTEDRQRRARELVLKSWEWKHWEELMEHDWTYFDSTDGMAPIVAEHEAENER